MAPPANKIPRTSRRQTRRRAVQPQELPYTRRNRRLFLGGLFVIASGYITLSIPPADGFMSMTLAPILLTAGYCVILPVALLIGERRSKGPENPPAEDS